MSQATAKALGYDLLGIAASRDKGAPDPIPLLALSGLRAPTPQRIEPRPVGGEEVAGWGPPHGRGHRYT